MTPPALGMPDLTSLLLLSWLVVGLGVGAALHHRGQPTATSLSALVVWPVLLPLLWNGTTGRAMGPNAARIESIVGLLSETLVNDPSGEMYAGLTALGRALHEADARIATVERLLASPTPADDHPRVRRARAELLAGRDRATLELNAVLAEMVELHLDVGLRELAVGPADLSLQIRSLEGRVRALYEVESLDAVR
jgi:hypothetical protein